MIEARGLGKRYGSAAAVDDLTFTIRPGMVTGFLGPIGVGKTTTMRLILGLDYPSAGVRHRQRQVLRSAERPMHQVGALLDAGAVHGGRTARNQLLGLAQTNGIGRRRVDEVLGLAGLTDVAGKRSKGFSLGMRQRLGIAAAPRGYSGRADAPGARGALAHRPGPVERGHRGHPVHHPEVVEKHVASIFDKLGLPRPTPTTAGSSPPSDTWSPSRPPGAPR
jgi:hypothetical protein